MLSSTPVSTPDDKSSLLEIMDSVLTGMARGNPIDLDAHLVSLEGKVLHSTKTTARCHYLQLDGNQRPKVNALARFLVSQVIDYSIPRKDIEEADNEKKLYGTTQKWVELTIKAKGLFTDLQKSGEGGELLLYMLVERFLRIPQLICKMPLKTNSNVHFHGVDGIHAEIDKTNNKLALYWGESKLHKSMNSAITDCFASLAKFLNSTGAADDSAERDIALIRDNVDLGSEAAQKAILSFLDPNKILNNSIEYRGVCLIGFDYAGYPDGSNTVTIEQLKTAIEQASEEWREKVTEKILSPHNLSSFVIEAFLVPFPDVEAFRAAFAHGLSLS